jgi:hypothetical protein
MVMSHSHKHSQKSAKISPKSKSVTPSIHEDKSLAKNPSPEVQHQIQMQKQLQIDLEHEGSGMFTVSIKSNDLNKILTVTVLSAIQATSFAFMMGFLLHLAYQQYHAAQHYHLLNDLERPDVSSFAVYGYSAGLHIDKGICVSHGWVFS